MEALLIGIVKQIEAGQTHHGIEAGDAHGMVVIPERGGRLPVGIVGALGLSGDNPVLGVTVVFSGYVAAVQVDDGAHCGDIRTGSVEGVIDGEGMLIGEPVVPLDVGGAAAGSDERRAGSRSIETPNERRRKIAMQLLAELRENDALGSGGVAGSGRQTDGARDRQRINERFEADAEERIRGELIGLRAGSSASECGGGERAEDLAAGESRRHQRVAGQAGASETVNKRGRPVESDVGAAVVAKRSRAGWMAAMGASMADVPSVSK